MAKKRVLVLNGSFCEAPIIKKAKEMSVAKKFLVAVTSERKATCKGP